MCTARRLVIEPVLPNRLMDPWQDVAPAAPEPGGGTTATLLIATYNRAALLRETLRTIAELHSPPGVVWDVVVVDNNSTDETREVVTSASRSFPVPLRYLHEPRQGKSAALNTALAAISSSIILFSDDDVRMPPAWLEAGVLPFLERPEIAYVGGPVEPMWCGGRPRWLHGSRRSAGVLALLDYGRHPFVFEDRRLIPLGVNMAVRRTLIDRIGGFHTALGRTGGSLLGQEQAEFFLRCRRSGARGLYVPEMKLQHVLPASRLSFAYFGRWWFWKGVSHARWYRMHHETELGVDLSRVPRLLGVPVFVYGNAWHATRVGVRGLVGRDVAALTDALFDLGYFIGYLRESWFGPRHFPREHLFTRTRQIDTTRAVR
jgi:glycosyltransferase involved in cell wall biosynthesis